jgi:hypothetical protein
MQRFSLHLLSIGELEAELAHAVPQPLSATLTTFLVRMGEATTESQPLADRHAMAVGVELRPHTSSLLRSPFAPAPNSPVSAAATTMRRPSSSRCDARSTTWRRRRGFFFSNRNCSTNACDVWWTRPRYPLSKSDLLQPKLSPLVRIANSKTRF